MDRSIGVSGAEGFLNRSMSARAWALLLALSVIWGGSFIFNRFALNDFEPLTVVLSRVAIAALALHVLVKMRGLAMPADPYTWRSWLVMGLLNNVTPFTLIVWGQTQISSGLASILNATTPLFSVTLAHFLTADERLTMNRISGVLLGIAGVAVLVGVDALDDAGVGTWGKIACLGASLSYACAGIWSRRLRANPPPINATGQVTCSALVMLVLALPLEQPWETNSIAVSSVLALFGLGLLSTAIGYLIFFRLIALAGATNTLLVTLIIPASASILAWLLLDEGIAVADLAGMVLIGSGLLAIDGRVPGWIAARKVQFRRSSASVQSGD